MHFIWICYSYQVTKNPKAAVFSGVQKTYILKGFSVRPNAIEADVPLGFYNHEISGALHAGDRSEGMRQALTDEFKHRPLDSEQNYAGLYRSLISI